MNRTPTSPVRRQNTSAQPTQILVDARKLAEPARVVIQNLSKVLGTPEAEAAARLLISHLEQPLQA